MMTCPGRDKCAPEWNGQEWECGQCGHRLEFVRKRKLLNSTPVTIATPQRQAQERIDAWWAWWPFGTTVHRSPRRRR